mgnify:CR=1 FL=1
MPNSVGVMKAPPMPFIPGELVGRPIIFAVLVHIGGADAGERLGGWQGSAERVLLLTRDVATMRRLAATGLLRGQEVNIGGIHHAPGRSQVLRYVFLGDGERQQLRELAEAGASVIARDVPGARGVPLDELLRTE